MQHYKRKTTPDEIVLLIAHLDSISKGTDVIAPGADDNASGCVGLLTAAKIRKSYEFKRTVRFVFTTGEEQSLCGARSSRQTETTDKDQELEE